MEGKERAMMIHPRHGLAVAALLSASLAGCSFETVTNADTTMSTDADDPHAQLQPIAPLDGTRVDSSDVGELCLYANEAPLIPIAGAGEAQHFGSGDTLVAQVTLPDCLSATCDVAREARCSVTRAGAQLIVESHFAYTEVDSDSCSYDCGRLIATCESEPLDAGDYQVAFAGEQRAVSVPSTLPACPAGSFAGLE
jgi:hypothetical protein